LKRHSGKDNARPAQTGIFDTPASAAELQFNTDEAPKSKKRRKPLNFQWQKTQPGRTLGAWMQNE
jgi:hypothetical protein